MRAAVRIISSDDSLASVSQETLAKLLDKHPSASSDRTITQDTRCTIKYQTTKAEVLKAIRSFPAGSCGGPDGVRPQHILDLISCIESGNNVVTAIIVSVLYLFLAGVRQEFMPSDAL